MASAAMAGLSRSLALRATPPGIRVEWAPLGSADRPADHKANGGPQAKRQRGDNQRRLAEWQPLLATIGFAGDTRHRERGRGRGEVCHGRGPLPTAGGAARDKAQTRAPIPNDWLS